MPTPSPRTKLARSQRTPMRAAQVIGPVSPDERFDVTIRVRRRAAIDAAATAHADGSPASRTYVTREAYADRFGSAQEDLDRIADFARSFGLVVVATDRARRSVFVSGTVAQYALAFDTAIEHYGDAGTTYRGRTGELSVPSELADLVEGVFGIDNRPAARAQFRYRDGPQAPSLTGGTGTTFVAHAAATSASFTPPQLAKLYDFPTGVDGSGQTIGIIELGGGYKPADLATYFKGLGLATPSVVAVRVDNATNAPTNANSADGEVMLDIEVAGGVAPKANIVVYFAPNTTKGFLDAITMAVHDTTHKPSVISISWGGAENTWTAQALDSYDQAFQGAATLGVTICCAAGDAGSGDQNPANGTPDGLAHADFPASSPNVLACGGTKITVADNRITAEVVWNENPQSSAGGGGISDHFAVPAYQASAKIPPSANAGGHRGRGLPDVAGDADPQSGYAVRVDGQNLVIGGTSAVAPLWAGLIALANQKLGKPVGFLNPLLYTSPKVKAALRDITSGNNGAYQAGPGWDACTGLGVPDGQKLVTALQAP
jgi:kumamolisin